jgi:rod shape-determining protein MreC
MGKFLDFFVVFKEYVALILFIAISLIMIAITRSNDVQPLRAFATAVVGTIQSTYAWIPNPVTLSRENKALQSRSIELAAEVGRLRRARAENDELRKLLGIRPRAGWNLLATEVVGKTSSAQRNMMTLDRGSNDGVAVGMAVITDAGLVGRIYAVSPGFSSVELLFNQSFRTAAKIARTRVEGIIGYEEGPVLRMFNVPKALDVQIGDLVVTSEYSTFFPAEVPVGTIIKLESEPNSLFRRVTIDPAANAYRVEHAFIVLKDPNAEREKMLLEQKAKEDALKKPKK